MADPGYCYVWPKAKKGRIVRYILRQGRGGTLPAMMVGFDGRLARLRVFLSKHEDIHDLLASLPEGHGSGSLTFVESGIPLVMGVPFGLKPGCWRWPKTMARKVKIRVTSDPKPETVETPE